MITPRKSPVGDDVARLYDSLDTFYRDTWGQNLHHGYWEHGDESVSDAIDHLTLTVASLARIKSADHVCDIGCGYGATSWLLAGKYQADLTSFTLSKEQHKYARLFSPKPLAQSPIPLFLQQDWLKNHLPPASFDAVISIECVSHVEDKRRFFREIHRTLKPGGRVVICAWIAAPSPAPWQVKHLIEPICQHGCIAGIASLSDYNLLIRQAGLQSIENRRIGKQVRKTWRVILRRVLWNIFKTTAYRRFIIATAQRNLGFLLTVPRLLLAYHLGSLDYAIIVAEKPRTCAAPPDHTIVSP